MSATTFSIPSLPSAQSSSKSILPRVALSIPGIAATPTKSNPRLPPTLPGIGTTPKIIPPIPVPPPTKPNVGIVPSARSQGLGPVRVLGGSLNYTPPPLPPPVGSRVGMAPGLPLMRPGVPLPKKSENKIYSVPAPQVVRSPGHMTFVPTKPASPPKPVSSPSSSSPRLNWELMDTIFREESAYLPSIKQEYVDDEIGDKITPEYFSTIFDEIDQLETASPQFFLRNLDDTCCLIREWQTETARLRFYLTEEDFAIVFEGPTSFLVVNNISSHPMVVTPDFVFVNSDGSTFITQQTFPSLSLSEVKGLLKDKAIDFLFNQCH